MLVLLFLVGTMLSWSSDSYFGMWVGLEVCSLAVYPLLTEDKSEASYSVLFKYYLLQVCSSVVFHLGFVIIWTMWGWFWGYLLGMMALVVKFGGVFIGWYLSFAEGISWMGLMLVLVAQKLPVLAALLEAGHESGVIMIGLGASLALLSPMVFELPTIRGLVVLSSTVNSAWIWCVSNFNGLLGVAYFTVYSLYTLLFCMTVSSGVHMGYSSSFWSSYLTLEEVILLASISGLPPFGVFLCKVEVMLMLVNTNMFMLVIVLVSCSLIMMYMYMMLLVAGVFLGVLYTSWKELSAGRILLGVMSLSWIGWALS